MRYVEPARQLTRPDAEPHVCVVEYLHHLQYGMTIIEAAACGAPTLLMLPNSMSCAVASSGAEVAAEPLPFTFVSALSSTLCVGGHHVAAQAFSRLQTAQHGMPGLRMPIPPAAVTHLPPVGASDLLGTPLPLSSNVYEDAAPAAFGIDWSAPPQVTAKLIARTLSHTKQLQAAGARAQHIAQGWSQGHSSAALTALLSSL